MSLPELGKLKESVFKEVIFPNLGAEDEGVIVKPAHGVDVGVIDLEDKALIVKSDPIFVVPEYGWERSAWFAVHILASDVATSGVPARYMAVDLNLPVNMKKEEFAAFWRAFSEECRKLGVAIVGGHTGKYGGCDYPMLGGATAFALAEKDGYVVSSMARVGDKVVVTKGPAIETSGILAVMFPQVLEERYGKEFALKAQELFWQQSVVKDALTAASVGLRENGVTAMHDATEYGLWGGLHEVATASGVGMLIHKDRIPLREDVKKVVRAFSDFTGIEIDPYKAISEGTLIITVRPEKAEELLERLKGSGIEASVVGEVLPREEGIRLVEEGGERELEYPKEDPFWPVFFKTVELLRGA